MPDYTVKADVDSMLRADNDAGIRSAIGLGQTDAPTFLAQSLTGQSLTGTQATSLVDLATTWLSTTGAPTAIKLNVTDTASNAASLLMDLQVGGVSKLKISKIGEIAGADNFSIATNSATTGKITFKSGFGPGTGLIFGAYNGFVQGAYYFSNQSNFTFATTSNGYFGFCPNSAINADIDVGITRDAAGILAQRNGTAKQVHRVYNTFLGTTANEWGGFDWLTTANTLRIGTEHGGTGAARPIDFVTGGVVRMSIAATGTTNFTGAASFNSSITCVSDFNGERDIYCGTNRYFRFNVGGATALSSSAAGVVTMADLGATNTTPRITLGGTTSSFPAIKRSTTSLQARLADDSAFTNIQGKLTTDTAYTATVVVPTGFLTLYDSTGTAYRVPCVV